MIESQQSKKEVLELYKNYCVQEERRELSRNNFYTNLRTKGYQEVKTNGDWYFVGFEMKSGVVLKGYNNVSVFPKKAQ